MWLPIDEVDDDAPVDVDAMVEAVVDDDDEPLDDCEQLDNDTIEPVLRVV